MTPRISPAVKKRILKLYKLNVGPTQISRIIEAEYGVDLSNARIGMILYHARKTDPSISYYDPRFAERPVAVPLMLNTEVINYFRKRTEWPLQKMAALLTIVAKEDLYIAVLDEEDDPCPTPYTSSIDPKPSQRFLVRVPLSKPCNP